MIRKLWFVALMGVGCVQDDVTKDNPGSDSGTTSDTATTPGTTTDPAAAMQGDWVSAGDDVSPLFKSAFFDLVEIDATFNADLSYAVTSLDGSGATVDYTGTYTVATDTTPPTIVLEQAAPSVATAEGIWQVDAGVLTYEVVQTTPDIGFAAPTPETGFGSTSGPGLYPGDNTQVYRRP